MNRTRTGGHHNHHSSNATDPHDLARWDDRTGGNWNEKALPGQVPEDKQGQARDIALLNEEIQIVLGQARRLGLPITRKNLNLTMADYDQYITEFYLVGDANGRRPPPAALLQPTFLDRPQTIVASCQPLVEFLRRSGASTLSEERSSEEYHLRLDKSSNTCRELSGALQHRKVQLWVRNLLTSFRARWFDSVMIDAFIAVIVQFWKYRDYLYVNSAEVDLNLDELAKTPRCYRYILSPLYRKHHWTILFIDHKTREIFYLNSDVVDRETPDVQTAPFARVFPGYRLHIIPYVKQCDNSSCGPYVCYWAYCFLYRRDQLLRISCPDIRRFRTFIRHQVICSFLVSSLYN